MMDKPSFSYPTTRAGRQEVGITEGGDIYQIFKKDPEKTYITRATPRQAEMFQEMLPDHLTDDKKKTPGAGGFLTAFTNKTFDADDKGAPPVETSMTLNFQELELITRERVQEGY